MKRPLIVTVIAAYALLCGIYACAIAASILITRGDIELPWHSPFIGELEYYGPFYGLLAGSISIAVAWGLFKLRSWSRYGAMLAMVLIVWQLMVPISMTKTVRGLMWYGLLIALHAAAGFYLAQSRDVLDAFDKK